MRDLIRGIDDINQYPLVSGSVSSGIIPQEKGDTQRHITRGVALAWLLIRDSTSGFSLDTEIPPLPSFAPRSPKFGPFMEARAALLDARRGTIFNPAWGEIGAEEIDRSLKVSRVQTDAVLGQASLDGFAAAVGNLTGPGLEEPTQYRHASYGAALVVLAMGERNIRLAS